jgi:radical SAM protein with 4Fe4S-binding SPASM domain
MLRRLRRWIDGALGRGGELRASRLESFGAIVQLQRPRALVFVDREAARELELGDGDSWRRWPEAADGDIGATELSAPLEAHLQLTNRCGAGCAGCYTGATPEGGPGELGLEGWKRVIDELAAMGVFHLALGGGESAELPWIGEIAAHARSRGVVPNLTTSGLAGLERIVSSARLFGQINVSLDGLGDTYRQVRGFDGFAAADRAIRILRRQTRHIGINVVVTRQNFAELDDIFAYARRRRLSEVELLRFKPSGRGAAVYHRLRCTDQQHRELLPTVLAASRRHRIRVKLDCSYTPMVAHHRPDPELLASLAVYGCVGGDFLVAAKATGAAAACSFAAPEPDRPSIGELPAYWGRPEAFPRFRAWREEGEPCRSCAYQKLCRGGCKVVSRHLAGDESAPDPECPRVIDAAVAGATSRARLPVVG